MFLSANTCDGKGECIKQCPTKAIKLINGKAFSCLTCGICYKNCPNGAIFQNSYGGYVVDRAKCNGCGMCMYNCPTNNISIEDGIVYGICSRCGVCEGACPSHSRVDGYELEKSKQLNLIESLKILYPPLDNVPHKTSSKVKEVTRNYFGTDTEKCILCGRCQEYCPTTAIHVKIDRDEGICSECRLCSDVCPNESMNKHQMVNTSTCTLCLNCMKACPRNAISVDDFAIVVNKLNQKPTGKIISCLNCGLCADLCENESLKNIEGKLRYDPTEDTENITHELAINACPVHTLREDEEMFIYDEFDDEELPTLSGFCVSCGKCFQVCDEVGARQFMTASWDGSVSDDCISCGICSEVCQEDAITLHRGTISVDLDKCILCENCAVHCPVDAIPKSTMYKNEIKDGFNFIEQELCMHCGLCHKTCSYDAIDEIDGNFVVNDEKCTYCGACKNACPARAFLFERNFKDSIEGI
ncbi:4Fe-4S binding protein [Methanobrevibacter sp.]|uniref:4Fe-4S binding protein n=1 Tax=Methanobrevibacter sp. TaxID=66852 RepID=UPI0025F52907|nr:4Fe-4S binding protein [Methanobrevibacter sp.]MBQ2830963.1 4Fe-4S binding protein [Methanobrevibacter sp.]